METKRELSSINEATAVESPAGISRKILAFDKDMMICHFKMKKGVETAAHDHLAVQSGYVISGKVKFTKGNGEAFTVSQGMGYMFSSMEKHAASILEDSELVEIFAPMRKEFLEAEAAQKKA